MTEELSDEGLMHSYKQGDFKAFETLYERYSGRVYGYLKKRLRGSEFIDDIHQAIFFKLHEIRNQYRSEFKFAPWLFVITRTSMLDYLRKQKKYTERQLEYETQIAGTTERPTLSDLDSTLETLSEKEATILRMRYSEDLDFDSIAKSVGTSQANVRQQISRAVKKVRKLVGVK